MIPALYAFTALMMLVTSFFTFLMSRETGEWEWRLVSICQFVAFAAQTTLALRALP